MFTLSYSCLHLVLQPGLPTEPEDDPLGPDGEFSFKRKRGALYRAVSHIRVFL